MLRKDLNGTGRRHLKGFNGLQFCPIERIPTLSFMPDLARLNGL